jgi:tetratricopeptide (TPR) repeat protein
MRRASLIFFALFFVAACSGQKRVIRIPDSVVPNPKTKKDADRPGIQPFVIKMSDGKNVYEAQIPIDPSTGSLVATIPLKTDDLLLQPPDAPQTEADREIIESKKANGERTPETAPGEPPKTKSYLSTLARVNQLYKKRQYELALIDITKLDREYPDDERILEMKGTLYWKLHRAKQAKEAWERVLALDPNNALVAQALEQLSQDGE